MSARRLLLIGAGHAHLHVARRAREFATRGIEVVLVNPGSFFYSGMASGVLGARYEVADDRLEPGALVAANGGRWIDARAVNVDAARREATLDSGERLGYDVVSVNVGMSTRLLPGMEGLEQAYPVSPVSNLFRLRERLEAGFAAGRRPRVLVAGGGAAGTEIAANLDGLARRRGGRLDITLASADARLVTEFPAGASRALARELARRGIALRLECPLARVEQGAALTAAGERIEWDMLVCAAGLAAPALLEASGLPLDDAGSLRVRATLQSVADDSVFGTGSCAALEGHPLPKLGVFGVRQAPVLADNLLAHLEGRPLRDYRPQRIWLAILNLGDGRGLARWGPLWFRGRLAMAWKDHLDRAFLDQYR